jgi:hypothetical protein
MLPDMAAEDELWIPMADEPIGSFVEHVQEEHPEIRELVDSPRRVLAFRTFAYIRVGIVLGRLLVEEDLEPAKGENWAEELMRTPEYRERLVEEVRAVAEEIAADPDYMREPVGPSDAERERFSEFAKRRLGADT